MTPDDALSRLIDSADLIEAAGRTFLLVDVPPALMDFLASYGADREDMEDNGDSEPDYDNEYDYRGPRHDLPGRTVIVGHDGIGRGSDGSLWRAVMDLRRLERVPA